MIITSVYYQILEYVIAPIGLMLFTFYVKGSNESNIIARKLSDNAIESLFIASYSHLMYYFSLTAHESHETGNPCQDDQAAALLGSIAGLLIIFIYRFFYAKLNGTALNKLIKNINYTAFGSMLYLTFIIVNSNQNIHHYNWTWAPENAWILIVNFLKLVIKPNHLIFIPFLGLILYIVFIRPPVTFASNLQSFLQNTKTELNDLTLQKLIELAKASNTSQQVRFSSYVKIAEFYFAHKEYKKALEAANIAKQLANSLNYPEDSKIGLRMLIVELHCLLDQPHLAKSELTELKENQAHANEYNKEFYDLWVRKLNDILTRYNIGNI